METKRNPWFISMLVGVAIFMFGLTVLGSPLLLGVGGIIALVSGLVVLFQALTSSRS
ncbi:hypothetical protein [Actinomyces respiraculi]|uniref:hypothetical protein n=1 Tax=Actinomyces respiraculi TaxID=2744574 RepID=UPI00141E96A2|nr:hypothetical protein [Actinomyces respiraculi]